MSDFKEGDKVSVLSGSPEKYDGKTGTITSIGDFFGLNFISYKVSFSEDQKDYMFFCNNELEKVE